MNIFFKKKIYLILFIYLNFLFFFLKNRYINLLDYFSNLNDFVWLWGFILNNFIFNIYILLLFIITMVILKNCEKNFKKYLIIFIIFFDLFKYNINIDFINNIKSININLTNGLVNIHPNFILLTYCLLFYLYFNKIKKNKFELIYDFFFFKKNFNLFFKIIFIGLFLGAWWSSQELNWGGWWNWDPVEISGFIIITCIILYSHNIFNYLNLIFLKNLIYILILLNFITTRLDILNSIHNFVVNELTLININYILIFLIFIFFLFNFNIKNFNIKINLNYFFFIKIVYLLFLFLIFLIFINFFNQLNTDFYLNFFKKILTFLLILYFYTFLKIKFNNIILIFLLFGFFIDYSLFIFLNIILFYKNINNLVKYHKNIFMIIIFLIIFSNFSNFIFLKNLNLNLNFYIMNSLHDIKILISNWQKFNLINVTLNNLSYKYNFNFFEDYLKEIIKFEFFNYKLIYSVYCESTNKNQFFIFIYNNLLFFLIFLFVKTIFLKNINIKFL